MTQPENFTAAQAADPRTPGQLLADIAALRPDLRAEVARNPSAYPGLLEWLGSLGEPDVDAAIAARTPAAQQTQQMPVLPPMAPQGQPWAGQAPPAQLPQPMAPGYASLPPQGGQPMGPGYGPGAPAPANSNKALWIILIIVGVLILLSVAGFFLVRALANRVGDEIDNLPDVTGLTGDANAYGDDAALDALWDACEAEDWQACDDLYMDSPFGSEYEEFGDTCGNRTGGSSYCVDEFGGGQVDPQPQSEQYTYGDDAYFDGLWDSCVAEDWAACDSLYMESPIDSEYESFGDTCGNRTDGTNDCVSEFAAGGDAFTYGDDAYFDGLWDSCEGGDWQACDDLFMESAVGSEYESYGDTCGNRQASGTGAYCVDSMG